MQHTKATALYNSRHSFTFHHVPITVGWTEAMWGEKFAQNFKASCGSQTHDPWHRKVVVKSAEDLGISVLYA